MAVDRVLVLISAAASMRDRGAAGAPPVEVDVALGDSALGQVHRRRELVLGHQPADRGPAEAGHAHDG